jgi:hypothetical protein
MGISTSPSLPCASSRSGRATSMPPRTSRPGSMFRGRNRRPTRRISASSRTRLPRRVRARSSTMSTTSGTCPMMRPTGCGDVSHGSKDPQGTHMADPASHRTPCCLLPSPAAGAGDHVSLGLAQLPLAASYRSITLAAMRPHALTAMPCFLAHARTSPMRCRPAAVRGARRRLGLMADACVSPFLIRFRAKAQATLPRNCFCTATAPPQRRLLTGNLWWLLAARSPGPQVTEWPDLRRDHANQRRRFRGGRISGRHRLCGQQRQFRALERWWLPGQHEQDGPAVLAGPGGSS